jgi:CspA family cold shock protein
MGGLLKSAPYGERLRLGNIAARREKTLSGSGGMAEGTIKRLTEKGFGFIDTGSGKDMFFHMSALEGIRYEDLREGQRVSYTEGHGPKGPRAENVRPV